MEMRMGAPYRIRNTVVELGEGPADRLAPQGLHRWRYELTPPPTGGAGS